MGAAVVPSLSRFYTVVMSTSDDSPSGSPSKGSPNHQNDGFIEILTAQEALFTQTESILLNLTDRAPGPDGMVSLDPKNLQALKDIVLNLKVRAHLCNTSFLLPFPSASNSL